MGRDLEEHFRASGRSIGPLSERACSEGTAFDSWDGVRRADESGSTQVGRRESLLHRAAATYDQTRHASHSCWVDPSRQNSSSRTSKRARRLWPPTVSDDREDLAISDSSIEGVHVRPSPAEMASVLRRFSRIGTFLPVVDSRLGAARKPNAERPLPSKVRNMPIPEIGASLYSCAQR